MENFIVRLFDEKNELHERYVKLKSFLFTEQFDSIDPIQQGLLQIQVSAMETYLKCLNERIVLLSKWLREPATLLIGTVQKGRSF